MPYIVYITALASATGAEKAPSPSPAKQGRGRGRSPRPRWTGGEAPCSTFYVSFQKHLVNCNVRKKRLTEEVWKLASAVICSYVKNGKIANFTCLKNTLPNELWLKKFVWGILSKLIFGKRSGKSISQSVWVRWSPEKTFNSIHDR